MRLQTEQEEEPEINLTSLIDVVFLLLIFFMVSATFERQALLRVELPEASETETRELPERIELVITESGDYFIGERMLADTEKSTLKLALSEALAANPDAVVVLRADARAEHGLVVRALDAAAAEGVRAVSIATIQADGGDQ
ncbi:MAG: biopolymer transporter ExbD [Wenzhouxiangellaceae bacterium]